MKTVKILTNGMLVGIATMTLDEIKKAQNNGFVLISVR